MYYVFYGMYYPSRDVTNAEHDHRVMQPLNLTNVVLLKRIAVFFPLDFIRSWFISPGIECCSRCVFPKHVFMFAFYILIYK